MSRTSIPVFILTLALLQPAVFADQDVTQVDGTVTDVTLYRNQAMVTRTLSIEGDATSLEIVVGNLPDQVVPDSLFAESGEHLEVRAVRFRSRAVGQAPREEVRKLDEEIERVSDQLELNRNSLQLLEKQSAYLDKLEGFVAPTASTELSQGVLNAESLREITKFSFEQRQEISVRQVELNREAKQLVKQIELLQRQRAELTNGNSKNVREAVLFVQKHDDRAQNLRLSYLVNNCGWSPTYTVRARQDSDQVRVEYNALIHQLSGEAWSSVKLTLSTASPAISASGPGLAPFRVALSSGANQPQKGQMAQQRDVRSEVQAIVRRQNRAVLDNQNSWDFAGNTDSSWSINGFANELQCLELTGGSMIVSTLREGTADVAEGPSLSYELSAPVSLTSRNDQQMVRIMQTDMPTNFYHVATPVLTSYVYREAELTNESEEDLLAGPMTAYLDNRFVGRGELPTVTRGQSFVIGFGADPQLRVRRELAEKSEGVQGGNRELKFSYRLVIENYKKSATPIRLIDRLPHSQNSDDIRVTLGKLEVALSDDLSYQRIERPKGILRWDIDAPASAIGDLAHQIMYHYSVEYDRNFQLANPGTTAQLQQEFEQLQRSRTKR